MTESIRTIFLSSTFRDLVKHRQAVISAIEGLGGYHCECMETFGARNQSADDFCRAIAAECDVFVGIAGHLYGSCPKGSKQSYTEREYNAAVDADKPRLMFIAPGGFPLPADLIEPDAKRRKQRAFRERVSGERMRDTFTSPDDLARRVVQAIRNWEQERAAERPSAEGKQVFMPLPPAPYFAHPYPMQPNFTGRATERKMLTGWLMEGNEPVFALTAIGGMGKSALTWVWLQRDVLGFPLPGAADERSEVADACRMPEDARPEGVLWWSFYERESTFDAFVSEALIYAGAGTVNPRDVPSAFDRMKALATLLQQRRFLPVLDGVERILRAYSRIDAAYRGDEFEKDDRRHFCSCTDPHAGQFLQRLAAGPIKSRVLLTSRLFPRELEGLAGCRREELTAMDPEHAVIFFHTQGVRGTRAEIEAACASYGYHPLALRLLAGVIVRDRRNPGEVRVAERHPVLPELKGKEQHHILQVAYDTLDKPKRALLSQIAAFRSPMTYETLLIFNPYKGEKAFNAALDELTDRGLLFLDREQQRYDLHPIVRQHAYERLADKEGVHTRLRDYFADVPTPDKDKVESVEDLNPVIELYHHTVRAGRYDEARELFRDRLTDALYYRFGAYQTCIELLRALFPDGEDSRPRLKDERAQGWTLNTLACSYSLAGQPRRAMVAYGVAVELAEQMETKRNVAIGLGNLANRHTELGELEAAEANLQRSIELCREIEDEPVEAIGHQALGWLLAYRGAFDKAAGELETSTDYWKRIDHTQGMCVDESYRALCLLLMGDAAPALKAARRARKLADVRSYERDIVRAGWLLGWSLVALAAGENSGHNKHLTEAETHLTEALTRCRRINLVELEPDILLAWARWHRVKGNVRQARDSAGEALSVADRCEYRLAQADCHNFLARLDLDAEDPKGAVEHARTAYERAWCDGPPYCYKPALDEAERLLEELGEGRPSPR